MVTPDVSNPAKLYFYDHLTTREDGGAFCAQCAEHRVDCNKHSLMSKKKGVIYRNVSCSANMFKYFGLFQILKTVI